MHSYVRLLSSDLFRYTGKISLALFFKAYFLIPGFRYSFWLRTCMSLKQHPCLLPMFWISRFVLDRYSYRYGIFIAPGTLIGPGFYIGHCGGIVVNRSCVIGSNFNISHGVTLGQANRGRNAGCPTVGNSVYIGPGAKVIGKIRIGNHAAIGANCVVTHDVPEHAVVVGVPGKVISYNGSAGYIGKTEPEPERGWTQPGQGDSCEFDPKERNLQL